MATRQTVRSAFYDELDTATSVPSDNITLESPNSTENLPAIVHRDAYRDVPMNFGTGPTGLQYDNNGNVTAVEYTTMREAQFTVTMVAETEGAAETVYEDVFSHFDAFTHPVKDSSSIQTDVTKVTVDEATPIDDVSRNPTMRGDALNINLQFKRTITQSVTAIEDVQQSFDIGDDGTDDISTTTN